LPLLLRQALQRRSDDDAHDRAVHPESDELVARTKREADELTGTWFPWAEGVNGNQAGEFATAWRHVHDIFTAEGVTNVVWVWSPNVEYGGVQPMRPLYPGDRYVDVMAVDGYNWGNTNGKRWQTFSQIFDHTISVMEGISGRPLMLGHYGWRL